MSELECVINGGATLGEGVLWSARERVVYWVDIEEGMVFRYDPEKRENRGVLLGKRVGTIAESDSGFLVAALEDGVYQLDFDSGRLDKWNDPMGGNPENRFNDGKAGPDGRFYVGSIGAQGEQFLYRINKDRSWESIEEGITCSNGLVWSLDFETLYYIDTPTMSVVAYDFDSKSGSIANKRVIIEVSDDMGMPDGMTIDSEGKLWVAHWEGYCVRRWDTDTGSETMKIEVPVARVTSCAFGGDDLRDLYITTASVGLSASDREDQPLAGGLFRWRSPIAGTEGFRFRA